MNRTIDFNEFAGGALIEQLNIELSKVLENIADPNTPSKTLRKLTLTLSFKPDEERDLSTVDIKTQSKLAPPKPLSTKIIIDRDLNTGKIVGAEYKKQMPGQLSIEETAENNDKALSDLKIIK